MTVDQLDQLTDLECRVIAYWLADRLGDAHPVKPTELLGWINHILDARPVETPDKLDHGYGTESDCLCGRNFDKVRGLREHLTKKAQSDDRS